MTFEVELGGRARTISIERTGQEGGFRVAVEGEVYFLDAERAGEYGLSILGTPAGGGTPNAFPVTGSPEKVTVSADLQIVPGSRPGELLVTLEGRTAAATLNGRRSAHAQEAGAQAHGQATISAPMPGRVVRVLVAAGDDVAAKQAVVVVEAMKMENELRAPRAGRVKEVSVAPGTSVEAGRILAVIE